MSQPQQGKPQAKPGTAKPASKKPEPVPDDRSLAPRTDTSVLTAHQKTMLGSDFADTSAERRRTSALGGAVPGTRSTLTDMPAIAVPATTKFDGQNVPPALQSRDVWKALRVAVESLEGKRSRASLEQVVLQFGLMVNPRYADDAPGKTRGHIFVWDVSRAMNCEIPHFVGAKELNLAQTVDWLRHEGPMRGWKRVSDDDILARANEGKLVVALPRELRTKHIALVLPQPEPADGTPRLTGIGLRRDVNVHPRDMFGAKPMECFFHD